ncbi:cytochrome c oxidase subunit II [Galbitalea sp. SE-J8]|uniref:aa3-type cytochrome oxidase subunit II n=1 Tax=Galbitalea sp. SE-J8 TaxID=3054952 RepID=UPI00259CA842|nr:cytochrome c oxidase subunit II [Galbitalea sp. SE-J8]MDM4763978.1 cytochrome c oxidase subunit II [Galbitalea sp. SE-J8]
MRSNRLRRWAVLPIAVGVAGILAGCTQQQLQGWLPGSPDTTNQTSTTIGLWVTSWIVLLAVGVVTWSLIIWAAVVYRRRKGQTGLPVQLRYNLPVEIFYTIVPLILVVGFFAFTARDQASIEADPGNPDVKIEVFGKRWSWDFNYLDSNVHTAGIQAQDRLNDDGSIDESKLPVLYLPVGEKVQIDIESRDVIHSFWIIDFLYKKDMIPGKTNHWYFTPTKEGTYKGKCAELCGQYHSLMLFTVKVVSPDEYAAYVASLAASPDTQGLLGSDYNTLSNDPGTGPAPEPESASTDSGE